ncbi:IclR family transcriptional regulator [Marispirochaeta aestuarii]|uniref:IclR family transcriptional regulator n=1 Tax=Marispirochaeta aestuarii TaxID=1963862 RepID=UPI0029C9AB92|nr:IclR family transcriptional regulator [Marispirochaeta aestuarii]
MKQSSENPRKKGAVQSIERAFDILELLSRDPQGFTLTEISNRLDLHKSTVHRLLAGLLGRHYVEKAPRTNCYRLGLGFVHMSGMYLNRIELKTEAEYYMRELANLLGQVVFLAIRKDGEVVYIDKIEKFDSTHRFAIIGMRRPFHCTAIGKALLFDEPEDSLQRILEGEERVKRTEKTVTEVPELLSLIRKYRDQGYSLDDEEWEYNTSCVAAPIYDYRNKVIAAISTAWSPHQTRYSMDELGSLVRQTALKISARLGYDTDEVEIVAV